MSLSAEAVPRLETWLRAQLPRFSDADTDTLSEYIVGLFDVNEHGLSQQALDGMVQELEPFIKDGCRDFVQSMFRFVEKLNGAPAAAAVPAQAASTAPAAAAPPPSSPASSAAVAAAPPVPEPESRSSSSSSSSSSSRRRSSSPASSRRSSRSSSDSGRRRSHSRSPNRRSSSSRAATSGSSSSSGSVGGRRDRDYSHRSEGDQQQQAQADRGGRPRNACRAFQRGACNLGARCRYSHLRPNQLPAALQIAADFQRQQQRRDGPSRDDEMLLEELPQEQVRAALAPGLPGPGGFPGGPLGPAGLPFPRPPGPGFPGPPPMLPPPLQPQNGLHPPGGGGFRPMAPHQLKQFQQQQQMHQQPPQMQPQMQHHPRQHPQQQHQQLQQQQQLPDEPRKLYVQDIPMELNQVPPLTEHFAQFGVVMTVNPLPDRGAATVHFETPEMCQAALRSEIPVLGVPGIRVRQGQISRRRWAQMQTRQAQQSAQAQRLANQQAQQAAAAQRRQELIAAQRAEFKARQERAREAQAKLLASLPSPEELLPRLAESLSEDPEPLLQAVADPQATEARTELGRLRETLELVRGRLSSQQELVVAKRREVQKVLGQQKALMGSAPSAETAESPEAARTALMEHMRRVQAGQREVERVNHELQQQRKLLHTLQLSGSSGLQKWEAAVSRLLDAAAAAAAASEEQEA